MKTNEELSEKYHESKTQILKLQDIKNDGDKAASVLSAQLAEITQKHMESSTKIKSLEAKVEYTEASKSQLEAQLVEATSNDSDRDRITILSAQLTECNNKLMVASAKIESLEAVHEEVHVSKNQLVVQLAEATRNLTESREKIAHLETCMTTFTTVSHSETYHHSKFVSESHMTSETSSEAYSILQGNAVSAASTIVSSTSRPHANTIEGSVGTISGSPNGTAASQSTSNGTSNGASNSASNGTSNGTSNSASAAAPFPLTSERAPLKKRHELRDSLGRPGLARNWSTEPYVVTVTVSSAACLPFGRALFSGDSAYPYVVVNAMTSTVPNDANGDPTVTEGRCTSSSVSKAPTDSTTNPIWNQSMAIGVEGIGRLLFTVIDKRSDLNGGDNFLGQATLDLKDFPELYSNTDREINCDIPLGNYTYPVYRRGQKVESLKGSDREGAGALRVSLRIPTPTENTWGYLFKLSRTMFGYTDGIKVCPYLFDHKLHVFDSPWGSESTEVEASIDCSAIAKITLDHYTLTEIPMDGFQILYSDLRKDRFMWATDSRRLNNLWMDMFLLYEDVQEAEQRHVLEGLIAKARAQESLRRNGLPTSNPPSPQKLDSMSPRK